MIAITYGMRRKWVKVEQPQRKISAASVAADVAMFLKSGHAITYVPIGVTGEMDVVKASRERAAVSRRKRPMPSGSTKHARPPTVY